VAISSGFIVPIIAFGRSFLVQLPPRSSWLSQETSEILPSDGVIFYTDGFSVEPCLLSARVFSDTLDIRISLWVREHVQHDDLYMF
jgi:hypothetical protein